MRRFAVVASILMMLAGCSVAPAPEAELAEAPIVGGARETGYPEVVAVYWSRSATEGGLCSGTVIGPYAVLTAKHCVFDDRDVAVPANAFVVIVGNDVNSMSGITSTHRVLEVRTTPGNDISADVESGNDIALVLLDSDIGVTPRAFATSGPRTDDPLTIVGFGRTSSGSDASGVKYRGTATTARVGSLLFETDGPDWTCQGDSGGPAIDPSGAVTGITSFGFGNCEVAYSYFTRVAGHRALIEGALAFVPPCVPRVEACNGADDDCDDAVDETGCTEAGQPCTSDMECMDASCEEIDGARICAPSCFPDDPAFAPCPSGLWCQAIGCGMGRCVPGTLGAAPDGAPCTADTDCASASCVERSGMRVCGKQCLPDFGCPAGFVCDILEGECGACIDPALVGPRGLGQPCEEAADCVSGQCGSDGRCEQTCSAHEACPADHRCDGTRCVPGAPVGEGAACTASAECATGLACEGAVCVRAPASEGGGCAVGHGRRASWGGVAVLALALGALASARRRRRST